MSSIAANVAARGTAVVFGSLLVLGVATGAALHLQALAALDGSLLAAAHGHAHPDDVADAFEVEHSRSPVDAWIVAQADPRVPRDALDSVLRTERLVYFDAGDRRLILLPAETVMGGAERHVVIAASAPALRLRDTVGGFVVAYGALAAVVLAAAALVLRATVRSSFSPMARAKQEAEGVLSLGQGQRLSEQAPEELAPLLHAVNGLLDRLDAAWAVQARFTAAAAHELRTPVAVMLGELDVALRHERDAATYRENLVSAREEVVRLAAIVDALTALARLDSGEAEATRTPTRARELLEGVVAAERSPVPVRWGAVDDVAFEANVPLLELAVGNLVRNAARHAPGAVIELRAVCEGDRLVFEVHDAGPGVPPEQREAVFGRFTRGPAAKMVDPGGLGLGLAFAREVARRHGGDCVLDASPLGGAVARLSVRWRTPTSA